jgi:RNA polymerase sigma factor (sigma-70 family)
LKIFDAEIVSELVVRWKGTKDSSILQQILMETNNLARHIANNYTSAEIDDFSQEALIKVMSSLDHYNPDISNVHTYFSTVIRNSCITQYAKAKSCESIESDSIQDVENSEYMQVNDADSSEEDCYVEELIDRNISRFPSMSPEVIAQATKLIYCLTRDGTHNKSRGVVSALVNTCNMSRISAKVVYRSTIIHMRMELLSNASTTISVKNQEMSILPELREFLGDEPYARFLCTFTGTTINIK